jgi:hypothetical protein
LPPCIPQGKNQAGSVQGDNDGDIGAIKDLTQSTDIAL